MDISETGLAMICRSVEWDQTSEHLQEHSARLRNEQQIQASASGSLLFCDGPR